MICLWALSPIAGQSFLRMLTVSTHNTNYTLTNITYPDFSQPSLGLFSNASDSSGTVRDLLFTTALLAIGGDYPDGSLPLDPWRNTNNFYTSPNTRHLYAGSTPWSIVGQPFVNMPGMDSEVYINMTFTTPYSFFNFECAEPVNTTLDALVADTPGLTTDMFWGDAGSTAWMANPIPGNGTSNFGTDLATLYFAMNQTLEETAKGATFTNEVALWQCEYYTQYNTFDYYCTEGGYNCSTDVQAFLPNGTNTYLPDKLIYEFLDSLGTPDSFNGEQYSQRSLLAQYLINGGSLSNYGITDPSTIYGYEMQRSLTMLINGYWQIGFIHDILTSSSTPFVPNSANATVAVISGTAAYKVSWPWLIVLVFSCFLLLGFGITGIILDSKTLGPDIIGFASSLTRDNRYIKLDDGDVELGEESLEGASSKNAYETMKDMKHHKVMLQDVRGHEDVGKIALGSVGLQHGAPLKQGRLYR